jgi:hypothetical protein
MAPYEHEPIFRRTHRPAPLPFPASCRERLAVAVPAREIPRVDPTPEKGQAAGRGAGPCFFIRYTVRLRPIPGRTEGDARSARPSLR